MKIKFLIICLFICSVASAQDFIMKEKLANRYYSRFDYYRAIPMYEQLLRSYPENYGVYEKLADSYRRINDSGNAERCYAFLVDTSTVKHEYLLFYAQALAHNGNYDKAACWYQKYSEAEPGDPRGTEFTTLYKNITSVYKDSASFRVRKMPFSSDASDFSPAYFGNDIVFASARKKISIVRTLYNWTNSSFLDLFIGSPDSGNAAPFSKELNSIYHEGPVTFSKNLDTIIFTRSNFYHRRFRKSTEGLNKLKLFQANWDKTLKRWVRITPLPFNSNQYSVGHPALSTNGQIIYFASDMPGGMGETDIYESHLVTDSLNRKSWSKPVNVGEGINSPGNEMFPYIDNEGNLWFASNGRPGLGGLDVFVARKTDNGFNKPVNPGFPVNTRFDDFGYITRSAGKDGYLSSDRFNAIGNDDIFSIRSLSRNLLTMAEEGQVEIKPDKTEKPNTANKITNGPAPEFLAGDSIKTANIYYDFDKFNIRPDAAKGLDKLSDIMNKYPAIKVELSSYADSRGTAALNMALSEKRAVAAAEYLYSKGIDHKRVTGKGFGDTMPLNKCVKGVKCTEYEYKVNRRTEFRILSVE
ncbi:MAG: OmpA family protein [Bacteroidota bacterium]